MTKLRTHKWTSNKNIPLPDVPESMNGSYIIFDDEDEIKPYNPRQHLHQFDSICDVCNKRFTGYDSHAQLIMHKIVYSNGRIHGSM